MHVHVDGEGWEGEEEEEEGGSGLGAIVAETASDLLGMTSDLVWGGEGREGATKSLGVPSGQLLSALNSLIWCTYRSGFDPIEPSGLTYDTGWGCMLRCGQMMLVNVLAGHFEVALDDRRALLAWFADADRPDAPYALHHMAQLGALRHDIALGAWFGPHTTSLVLAELVGLHDPGMGVVVATDATLFVDRVSAAATTRGRSRYQYEQFTGEVSDGVVAEMKRLRRVCVDVDQAARVGSAPFAIPRSASSSRIVPLADAPLGSAWDVVGVPVVVPYVGEYGYVSYDEDGTRVVTDDAHPNTRVGAVDDVDDEEAEEEEDGSELPILILIPLRLGLRAINPKYYAPLREYMSFPQSRGAMGGRPNSAFYFVGVDENYMVYLDPHTTQGSVDVSLAGVPLDSYMPSEFRKLHFSRMDPTLTLAFYCRNEADREDLYSRARSMANPVFSVLDHFVDFEAEADLLSSSIATATDVSNGVGGGWDGERDGGIGEGEDWELDDWEEIVMI